MFLTICCCSFKAPIQLPNVLFISGVLCYFILELSRVVP